MMNLTPTRKAMWLLFAFGLLSWLIAMAGLSAVQDACGRYGYNRYGAGEWNVPRN